MPDVDFRFLIRSINFKIDTLNKCLSDYGARYAAQKDDMIVPSIKALLEIKGAFNRDRLNFDYNERYDIIKYNINKLQPENESEEVKTMIEILKTIELYIAYYIKSVRELPDPEVETDSGTGGKRKSRKSRKGRKGRKGRKSRKTRKSRRARR